MNRRFGIEMEISNLSVSSAVSALTSAGISVMNVGYTHQVMSQWKVVLDGSVMGGCEVVSPPLSGEAGLAEVRRAADALKAAGAKVNKSCGLHVHVEARGLSTSAIAAVALRYSRFEEEIDQLMPASRRGSMNSYCRPVDVPTVRRHMNQGSFRSIDRYYKVNLASFTRYGTIEFRHHSGTVDAIKVENWIRFCVGFVNASVEEGGAQASVQLGRNERTVVQLLREGRISAEGIHRRLEGAMTLHSVGTVIHRLRKKGYQIETFAGTYRLVEQTTSTAPTERPLWHGVPQATVDFYARRREALNSRFAEAA